MSERGHFVYEAYDADGVCLYVGRTTNPHQCWRTHMNGNGDARGWFNPFVRNWRVAGPYAEQTAVALQKERIVELRPIWNGSTKGNSNRELINRYLAARGVRFQSVDWRTRPFLVSVQEESRRRGPNGGVTEERRTHPHYVYRLYDTEGRLLYVGMSVNPIARVASHQEASWFGERIARTRLTVFPNREYALAMEREAIYSERPICNVRGRWYKRDPRTDWSAEDYALYHHAVIQSAGGFVGVATSRLLADIRREAAERFGLALLHDLAQVSA